MNPFRKSPAPLRPLNRKDQARWICPQDAWRKLGEYVENEVNVVILGVEGSGKSTLLNWFFTDAFCAQAAEDNKLIFFADLSDTISGSELCKHLTAKLKDAAERYLPEEYCQALEQSLNESARKGKSEKITFINACETLYRKGYTMLLVMDGFERFVSSPNVTQDQHDMLRGLLDKDVMRCVVATNYDLEESSVPEDVAGSLYLQKFQDKITLPGFTEEEARQFITGHLGEHSAVTFNDRQLNFLQELTGRIPAMYEMAASFIYDELEKCGSISPADIRRKVYNTAKPTMQRWSKLFKPTYEQTIRFVLSGMENQTKYAHFVIPMTDSPKITAADRLKDRGLWRNIQQNEYAFNSSLLQEFFRSGDYAKPGKSTQPAAEPVQPLLPEDTMGKNPGQTNFYGPVHITLGNTNINSNNTTYNSVLATRSLLDLLVSSGDSRESFANALHARLIGALPQQGLLGIEQAAGLPEDEYDQMYDAAFSEQVSGKVVDSLTVDQDEELVEITEQEQMSLDHRFEEARKITRPGLSDAMLRKVSPRTAFYLKLSVVVEDALSVLKLLHTSGNDSIDCSAQLILYGKAVEQQLKDSFYPLFHREPNLRDYQVKKMDGTRTAFENVTEDQTSIGTYKHALQTKAVSLGQLCVSKGLQYRGESFSAGRWCTFWHELKNKIEDVRNIRNLSAHTNPDECPTWEHIDSITKLSFEEENSIFECCTVGTDLNTAIFGYGSPLSLAEGKALEGTEAVFCCTKVKHNSGMDGYIESNHCAAKIGPAKAKKYKQQHPEVTMECSGRYRVLLEKYQEQDGTLYFASDLLGPA